VVVGPHRALLRDRLGLREVNWLGDDGSLPADGVRAQVKLRSTQPPVAARVFPGDAGNAEVVLDQPQAGVAPGQACVFYDADRVLGGGWIRREPAAA
jgi:tRNA-specific 2-thiouridylase